MTATNSDDALVLTKSGCNYTSTMLAAQPLAPGASVLQDLDWSLSPSWGSVSVCCVAPGDFPELTKRYQDFDDRVGLNNNTPFAAAKAPVRHDISRPFTVVAFYDPAACDGAGTVQIGIIAAGAVPPVLVSHSPLTAVPAGTVPWLAFSVYCNGRLESGESRLLEMLRRFRCADVLVSMTFMATPSGVPADASAPSPIDMLVSAPARRSSTHASKFSCLSRARCRAVFPLVSISSKLITSARLE